jgi:hypothetical protein
MEIRRGVSLPDPRHWKGSTQAFGGRGCEGAREGVCVGGGGEGGGDFYYSPGCSELARV